MKITGAKTTHMPTAQLSQGEQMVSHWCRFRGKRMPFARELYFLLVYLLGRTTPGGHI